MNMKYLLIYCVFFHMHGGRGWKVHLVLCMHTAAKAGPLQEEWLCWIVEFGWALARAGQVEVR